MLRKIVPDVVNGQSLLTLPPTASVREAARRMAERKVRSVLIVKGGKLAGIFTGSDLNDRVVAPGLDPDKTTLDRVMTRNPESIAPGATAIEALRRMQEGRHRHLPVVADGKLVAIISRVDFHGFEIEAMERQRTLWERI